MLEERQILLSLQKKDLKVQEAKLAEEQAHNLYSLDGQDLLAKLEELHVRVAGVDEERAANAAELAVLVVEASNIPVVLPSQLPRTSSWYTKISLYLSYPGSKNRTEVSICVPRMFKSHI
jgi:hypothetical protein